jgi:hypothetical protein
MTDNEVIQSILNLFGEASGLQINLQKSSVTCIHCDDGTAASVTNFFQCQLSKFPIRYLGLPLTIGRLRCVDIWPLRPFTMGFFSAVS